jgi:hypothetical protein
VAKEGRPFLFSGEYVGPDRRFRDVGPPNGVGRRREDLIAQEQAAKDPNSGASEPEPGSTVS